VKNIVGHSQCKECDLYLKMLLGVCPYATYIEVYEIGKEGKIEVFKECYLESAEIKEMFR